MWNIDMLALKPEKSQNIARYKFNSRTKLSHIREELHLEEKLLWARHRKLFVIIV